MSKACCVCSKDLSPYKCPKCSLPYCSVACCKAHKESCSLSGSETNVTESTSVPLSPVPTATSDTIDVSDNFPVTVTSSQRLKDFLAANPYLQTQLPVLLARIDRHDPAGSVNPSSQLAKDLEKRERVTLILKEAIETDPKVAELYKLLQDENML